MEHFFEFQTRNELPWFDDLAAAVEVINQSAFKKYTDQGREGFRMLMNNIKKKNENKGNVNKRMVNFLKKNWSPPSMMMAGPVEAEKERNHRHMIHERQRREKEKQCYIELHSLLPNGTKSDKNSIVQMAKKTIEDLERVKEELQKNNQELEMMMMMVNGTNRNKNGGGDDQSWNRIKLRIAFPSSSGIDSFLEVIKCLKSTGSIAKVIHSTFSTQEFSAILQIETKIGAAEVEKAVQRTLIEVERKFRSSFPEE